MDSLQKELSETQNSYNIQNEKVEELKKQLDGLRKNPAAMAMPGFSDTLNSSEQNYRKELTKLNELTKKIQKIKLEIKTMQESKPSPLPNLHNLQKELLKTQQSYASQDKKVDKLKKEIDALKTNSFFPKEVIGSFMKTYNSEIAILASLENKSNQLKAEISRVTKQQTSPPHHPSTKDAYSKQLAIVKHLQDAQDALAHDPGSVSQEGKLAEYRKKYAGAIAKLNQINQTLQNIQRRTETDIQETAKSIKNYRETLNNNQQLFNKYSQDIKSKMQLVATRDRMLQLSQERNVYKKKVINVLISIVVALLVAVVAAYTFYGKTA